MTSKEDDPHRDEPSAISDTSTREEPSTAGEAETRCLLCDGTDAGEAPLFRPKPDVAFCERCMGRLGAQASAQERARGWRQPQDLPSPRAIRAKLDEYVVGQDRAKVDLSVAVYNHYKRRRYLQERGSGGSAEVRRRSQQERDAGERVEIQKSNILLLGPTGTGKTELARAMSRMLGVPFHQADATQLTASGYAGDDVDTVLSGLMASADYDVARAEWGIVLLDEFDNLARASGRHALGYRGVGSEGVQQALLRMIEGQRMKVSLSGRFRVSGGSPLDPVVDTSNILFICAGSFASSIEQVVSRRVNRGARIGFGGAGASRRELGQEQLYELVGQDDVLDMGIIPELVGRLPVLSATLPLTEAEMVRVLIEPKHSIIKQYRALLAMEGVELTFDEQALTLIARQAMSRPTGARGLRSIVEEVLRQAVYEHAGDPRLRVIRVTRECVEGRSGALIERSSEPRSGALIERSSEPRSGALIERSSEPRNEEPPSAGNSATD
ncbi:MAG: ATP-dependent Clp protease ATP-binding subunit ClpX [Deltaproteobacteria bacterium]|jgi:ATP-dependent Clp protease ATP-binding subunit ClpX|nr:ATP-dependent Clp protease ATP-binding subunit ClpX [Deltaproteobacteria bacterium]MBW2533030.1 ATP-dependent Clp protease ATP-binding subunit ClpX [Deltaproteobacteria bacterium]